MRPIPGPSPHSYVRGSAQRGLLLFLIGALFGANAIYFLMVRNADCDCAPATTALPDAAATEAPPPAPSAGVAARAAAPAAEAAHAGPPLRVHVRPTRTRSPSAGAASPAATPATGAGVDAAPRAAAAATIGPGGLLLPVSGITAAELSDTFTDSRGTERVHDAIDIMAPAGTPVLAVADGHVEKLFDSVNGGLTIYQFEPSGRYVYYYAHLQRYAAGLKEGDRVRRGQVIGYVGSSGNASPEAPHLHFAILILGPDKRWSGGTPINPYPLLGGG
jgi:peptidoglycan LD-endopeptidase LytH